MLLKLKTFWNGLSSVINQNKKIYLVESYLLCGETVLSLDIVN